MQQKVLHQLKLAQGNLDEAIKMVQSTRYCIDIINRLKEARSTLQVANGLILENHLKTCAYKLIKQGKRKEANTEILAAFRLRLI